MKKVLLFITGFAFIVSGTLSAAYAEDIAGRSAIGVGYANVSPDEGDIDDGTLMSINYTRGVNNNLSIELSLGEAVLDVNPGDIPVDLGEATVRPLQVTAQYRIPSGNLSPYVGAGLGYYFNDFDLSGEAEDAIAQVRIDSGDPTFDLDVDVDDSFGFHIDAGVDYFVNSNFALNIDARYFWSQADAKMTETRLGTPDEIGDDEIDLDSFVIGVGAKYFF